MARAPILSFGSWDALPETEHVVQICHPHWRGVRTAAYAFRFPVIECSDLTVWGAALASDMRAAGIDTVVIQGWPPGSAAFVDEAAKVGVRVKCVLHSSPAQHGAERGEASVVDEVLSLAARGRLAAVGMVKEGVADAFRAAGHRVSHVPNRSPELPEVNRLELGPGFHVGVFAAPFWRKNVVTQLLAIGLLDGATAHVMDRPSVGYLADIAIIEHRQLPWEEFMDLQGSVALNLYVTLTECHPLTPVESYLLGVPCLISRTSGLFKEDEELYDMTTTDRPDEPWAIAEASIALLQRKDEAVSRARTWIEWSDGVARSVWEEFIR